MKSFFITGTDTGIGKTFVACALMVALRARGINVAPMKPVAAGTVFQDGIERNEDVHTLLALYGRQIDASLVNPYCFAPPIAPHIAAAREDRAVDLAVIESAFRQLCASHDCVIVEGAGGFLVPLSATESMSVLPERLGLEVILVVGMRLGCLNHALLTVEAILARGLRLAGWAANTLDPDMACFAENVATLKETVAAPFLGILPRLPRPAQQIANNDVIGAAHSVAVHLQIEPLLG